MSTPDLLENLNEAQREAVTAPPGSTLVIAGPGSGKTAVLTRRVAYLIRERGVAPWRIMTVTFTNKAAREMRERVEKMMGTEMRGVRMGTFHAMCAQFLRREAKHVGLRPDYVIYDTDDQLAVMKRVTEAANLDPRQYAPRGQLSKISNAKNELIGPMEYPEGNYNERITADLYRRYQDQLHLNNAVDFDDLILLMVKLLEQQPERRQYYQDSFDHILVDEFQDTNTAQYRLISLMAGTQTDLFCVGDPDQSIYKFRGADYRNITRFQKDYPKAKLILLEENYRSHQLILDAAMAIIDENPDRIRKQLTTARLTGPKITIRSFYDENAESQFIVEQIVELVGTGQATLRDCAVMYRTNAQSRGLEEAFVQHHIAYRLVGALRFYGRREIKDLLAYLKVIHNSDDDVSLERVINTPARGIGAKTVGELKSWASKRQLSMFRSIQLIREGVESPFTGRASKALIEFAALIDGFQQMKDQIPVSALLDEVITRTGFGTYLNDGTPEGQDRIDNVRELSSVTFSAGDTPLADFLAEVSLVADADTRTDDSNAAVLLTLHAAKGLEFPVVFIAGLEEGILPHQRSLDDPEQMEEEHRLMYVGITRAKDRLFLSWAAQRSAYGGMERSQRSMFIKLLERKIPDKLILNTHTRSAASWDSSTRAAQSQKRQPQFRTGQRVRHAKFGDGIVITSMVRGDDEEVDVKFESERVIKRLAASLANLKVLEK